MEEKRWIQWCRNRKEQTLLVWSGGLSWLGWRRRQPAFQRAGSTWGFRSAPAHIPVCGGVAHVPGGAGQDGGGGGFIPVCRPGPEPWGGVGVDFQWKGKSRSCFHQVSKCYGYLHTYLNTDYASFCSLHSQLLCELWWAWGSIMGTNSDF